MSKEQERLRKKQEALKEVITTEKSYVSGLEHLLQSYVNPLKALSVCYNDSKVISPEDFNACFSGFYYIVELNQALLKVLGDTFSGEDSTFPNIAKVISSKKEELKGYTQFVNHYDSISLKIKKLQQTNKNFDEFMNTSDRKMIKTNTNDFWAYFVTPVQRIPRYILLLRELLKYTTKDEPDYEDIKKAMEDCEEVANYINFQLKCEEHSRKTTYLKETVKGLDKKVISMFEDSKYLHEGRLEYVSSTKKKLGMSGKACDIYLFSYFVLICFGGKYQSYILLKTIPVPWVKDDEKDDTQFAIVTKERMHHFIAKNLFTKTKWVTSIKSAMEELIKNNVFMQGQKEARAKRRSAVYSISSFNALSMLDADIISELDLSELETKQNEKQSAGETMKAENNATTTTSITTITTTTADTANTTTTKNVTDNNSLSTETCTDANPESSKTDSDSGDNQSASQIGESNSGSSDNLIQEETVPSEKQQETNLEEINEQEIIKQEQEEQEGTISEVETEKGETNHSQFTTAEYQIDNVQDSKTLSQGKDSKQELNLSSTNQIQASIDDDKVNDRMGLVGTRDNVKYKEEKGEIMKEEKLDSIETNDHTHTSDDTDLEQNREELHIKTKTTRDETEPSNTTDKMAIEIEGIEKQDGDNQLDEGPQLVVDNKNQTDDDESNIEENTAIDNISTFPEPSETSQLDFTDEEINMTSNANDVDGTLSFGNMEQQKIANNDVIKNESTTSSTFPNAQSTFKEDCDVNEIEVVENTEKSDTEDACGLPEGNDNNEDDIDVDEYMKRYNVTEDDNEDVIDDEIEEDKEEKQLQIERERKKRERLEEIEKMEKERLKEQEVSRFEEQIAFIEARHVKSEIERRHGEDVIQKLEIDSKNQIAATKGELKKQKKLLSLQESLQENESQLRGEKKVRDELIYQHDIARKDALDAEQKCNESRGQLLHLRRELEMIKEENTYVQEEYEEYKNELGNKKEQLEREIEEENEVYEDVTARLPELKLSYEQRKRTYRNLSQENQSLKINNKIKAGEVKKLKERLSDLKDRLQKLQEQKESMQRQQQLGSYEVEKDSKLRRKLRGLVDMVEEKNALMEMSIHSRTLKLENVKKANEKLRARLQEMQQQMVLVSTGKDVKRSASSLRDQCVTLNYELEKGETEKKSFEKFKVETTGKLNTLNHDLGELNYQLESLEVLNHRQEMDISRLMREVATLKKSNASKENLVNKIRRTCEDTKSNHQRLSNNLRNFKMENDLLQRRVAHLKIYSPPPRPRIAYLADGEDYPELNSKYSYRLYY